MVFRVIDSDRKAALFKIGLKLLECPIIAFFFDLMGTKLILLYLTWILKRWKRDGLLENYVVSVQRMGFLCYGISLRVWLEKRKTREIVFKVISGIVSSALNLVYERSKSLDSSS